MPSHTAGHSCVKGWLSGPLGETATLPTANGAGSILVAEEQKGLDQAGNLPLHRGAVM